MLKKIFSLLLTFFLLSPLFSFERATYITQYRHGIGVIHVHFKGVNNKILIDWDSNTCEFNELGEMEVCTDLGSIATPSVLLKSKAFKKKTSYKIKGYNSLRLVIMDMGKGVASIYSLVVSINGKRHVLLMLKD